MGNGIRESVQALIDRLEADDASGSVLVAVEDEAVLRRGFGHADRDADLPCHAGTVHCIGSITKQFTAAAVLRLEAMGLVSVTDPIGRHLSPVPTDKSGLTIHHLLTHTAGLIDILGDDYAPIGRDQLVTRAFDTSLVSRPGTAFRYSNLGYSLLAAIIERVSGSPYERFLAEQLFAPAGMECTGYVLPGWGNATLAVGYHDGRRWGTPLDHPWAEDGPYWNLRGNGGLLSTAEDMLHWHLALRRDAVLSADAKRRLFTPYVAMPADDASYGYAWVVSSSQSGHIVRHAGSNGVMLADFVRLVDEDAMIFVATNDVSRLGGLDNFTLTDELITRVRTHRDSP